MAKLLSGTRIYGTGTVDTQLFVNGTEQSISTTTGALEVVGGIGLGGNIVIGGSSTVTNNSIILGTTAASSTITGALQVRGGAGIGGKLYTGDNAQIGAGANLRWLTVNGGDVGVGAGALVNIQNNGSGILVLGNKNASWGTAYSPDAVIYASDNLIFQTNGNFDRVKIAKLDGVVTVYSTITSISTITGALQVVGGIGLGGNLYIGGNANIAGNEVVTGTLQVNSGNFNTGTNTLNALYTAGGAWIEKTLVVGGDTTFKGSVVFQGTNTFVYSSSTVYTDNLISLHAPAGSGPGNHTWTVDDGKDIGFLFHYYKGADLDAFLGFDNATQDLEWFSNGVESGGVFTGTTYGRFRTGSIRLLGGTANGSNTSTGDLAVLGGVGIGGGLFVGGTVTATNFVGAFSGAITGAATQVNTVAQLSNATYYPTFVDSNNASASAESLFTTSTFAINPNTGNVGIGIAPNANYKLRLANLLAGTQVDKTIFQIEDLYNAGANGQYFKIMGGAAGINLLSGWGNLNLGARVTDGNDTFTSHVTINGSGQVGIGITSPSAKLHVDGTARITGATIVTDATLATSTATGALQVVGGAGIGRDLYVGGDIFTRGTKVIPVNIQEFTATGGQTTFTVSGGYTVGTVQVFANGINLGSTDFTASNGTTVVVNLARKAGDIIRVISGGTSSSVNNIETFAIAMSIALGI